MKRREELVSKSVCIFEHLLHAVGWVFLHELLDIVSICILLHFDAKHVWFECVCVYLWVYVCLDLDWLDLLLENTISQKNTTKPLISIYKIGGNIKSSFSTPCNETYVFVSHIRVCLTEVHMRWGFRDGFLRSSWVCVCKEFLFGAIDLSRSEFWLST